MGPFCAEKEVNTRSAARSNPQVTPLTPTPLIDAAPCPLASAPTVRATYGGRRFGNSWLSWAFGIFPGGG
ncbi:hypothetical protein FRX94_07780 [Corynebacterium canis]|uniref:Uncharacterized protein n=1 Tax=Corynebacterium canis TaxID=679663 RepID=A0A5C5UGV3_9CORY|nr:hypothetical protein [Corynebacterium canis]TWT24575.1 hypothetical protein FRX94_07780 [Corynebacterium canis]